MAAAFFAAAFGGRRTQSGGEPGFHLGVGLFPDRGKGQEHVVTRIGDWHRSEATAQTARPTGHVRHVQHGVGAIGLDEYRLAKYDLSERSTSDGTATSSPACSSACPLRIARIQPKVTGKPPRGFNSRLYFHSPWRLSWMLSP